MSPTRLPPTQRPPEWADRLVRKICADWHRRVPRLRWRRRSGPLSSGATYYDGSGIGIIAGTDRREVRMVLLHELAHHLVGPSRQHDEVFWRCCWELYLHHGVDLRAAWRAETSYRKRAATFAPERVRARFERGRPHRSGERSQPR
jgi:WLM domain